MPPLFSESPADPSQMVRLMSSCVPELASQSAVGIVGSREKVLRQIGTGTLLAVADHRFVVTAGHVIRKAREHELTVGVSGANDGRFLAATHPWWVSGKVDDKPDADPHDVAVYEFSPEQLTRLSDASFVRIADVSFERDLSMGFFLVSGFPGMWSTTLTETDPEAPMTTKLLQYGPHTLQGSTAGLDNYHQDTHFLLDVSPSTILDATGAPASFRTLTGHHAQMPQDLLGVSGCSVWMIGDLRRPLDTWSTSGSRLVGVETGAYPKRSAIKVTRWNAVTTLLYNCIPSLRNVMDLYANQ